MVKNFFFPDFFSRAQMGSSAPGTEILLPQNREQILTGTVAKDLLTDCFSRFSGHRYTCVYVHNVIIHMYVSTYV